MRLDISYMVLFFLLMFASCDSSMELDVDQPDALIVVDGWMEQGKQAKVMLTTNMPYFDTIDSTSIRDLVLTRAKVTLSVEGESEVLILRRDDRYFPPYYYAGNTIYGDTGKVYNITAEYGGKITSAETTIPKQVAIDSVMYVPSESAGEGKVRVVFTDPLEEKNFYRLFTKRLGKDDRYLSTFIMALDDQYFNGEQVSFSMSMPPKSMLSTEESEFFVESDTIMIKLCTMDKASFDFWDSYQEEVISATNPFASAMMNLKTNTEGDGLGIWSGYGVSIDTVYGY